MFITKLQMYYFFEYIKETLSKRFALIIIGGIVNDYSSYLADDDADEIKYR